MPKYFGVILLLCLTFLFTGCGQENEENLPDVSTVTAAEIQLTIAPTSTPIPTKTALQPTQQHADAVEQEVEVTWVLSGDAANYLGQVITVRVEQSHCAYKPSINGSPTFCNDQPYPDHTFTYLVWGQDWSHFDQLCVLVTGEIESYDGTSQIVVEEEGQVAACEGG
jgi:hypothetical protein